MLEIQYIATDNLIPYINNSRTHSEAQIHQITASIVEFGFTNPVLIDEKGMIIAGHGRVEAAKVLGIDEIPTITLKGLTDIQRQAYVIADNKLSLNSDWDYENLRQEIENLTETDFDIDLIGFSEVEIMNLLDMSEDTSASDEWEGMPEYDQPNAESFRHCTVHFENEDDAQEFFSLIGQTNTGKTNSIWHPQKERRDTESKRYQ
tara:strand:- start:2297 stop:2911 length:615 start_codon:yes stop_codon:yes gene_type:complete